jgi:hypothetical protein
MKITIIPLSTVANGNNVWNKFILLEDGRLLYGMCRYHKDLSTVYFSNQEEDGTLKVIGAGIVPEDVRTDIEDSAWGGWESTGYDVVTPLYMRTMIQEAFIDVFLATS